jgi:hypothetical protein
MSPLVLYKIADLHGQDMLTDAVHNRLVAQCKQSPATARTRQTSSGNVLKTAASYTRYLLSSLASVAFSSAAN